MKLFLPVVRVERDVTIRGNDRYKVTLSDDYEVTVEYTTATQPAVGQRMVVTIEPEK